MKYDQLDRHFGGPQKIATALGIKSRQTVHSWKSIGVPAKWQLKAERLSGGKLRADREARREAAEFSAYWEGRETA